MPPVNEATNVVQVDFAAKIHRRPEIYDSNKGNETFLCGLNI